MELPAQEIKRAWKVPSPIRASVYAALAAVVFGVLLPDFRNNLLVVLKILVLPFLGGWFLGRSARRISSLLVLLPASVLIIGLNVYVQGARYAYIAYGRWGLSALDRESQVLLRPIAMAELVVFILALLGTFIGGFWLRRSQARS